MLPENYHRGQKVTCFIINTKHFCDAVGKEIARIEYVSGNTESLQAYGTCTIDKTPLGHVSGDKLVSPCV